MNKKFYIVADNDYNILLTDGTLAPWSGPIINLPDNVRKFTSPPTQQAESLLPKGSRILMLEDKDNETTIRT